MKQHQIKIFRPNSKQAECTILSVTPEAGIAKVEERLDEQAAEKVRKVFGSLLNIGAESTTFRHEGRKIKVALGEAA